MYEFRYLEKPLLAAVCGCCLSAILISCFSIIVHDEVITFFGNFSHFWDDNAYANINEQSINDFSKCEKYYHFQVEGNSMHESTQSIRKEKSSGLLEASSKIRGPIQDIGVWFYPKMLHSTLTLTIIDEFDKLGINVIYFGGTTVADWKNPTTALEYSKFICYAYSKNIRVYAATLEDPTFAFLDAETLEGEFQKFISLTKGLFDTYIVDVEPHVQHLSDPSVYLPNYIRMSLALKEIAAHNNVTYIDTVPYWYHIVIKNLGISPGIDILGGNSVNIMDYSTSAKRSIDNIGDIIKDVKKPHTISIKITPGYGDPYLNEGELEKTREFFTSHSISYGIFESQYLLRNYYPGLR